MISCLGSLPSDAWQQTTVRTQTTAMPLCQGCEPRGGGDGGGERGRVGNEEGLKHCRQYVQRWTKKGAHLSSTFL